MLKYKLFIPALAVLFISSVALFSTSASAQEDNGIDDIESQLTQDEERAERARESAPEPRQLPEVKSVGDLGKLEPFGDVAVIQRRFLPKTGRFEAFAGGTMILNDAFFQNFGLNGRIGYNFSERYGIEFQATALTFTERQVIEDLFDRGIRTTAFVTPQSYTGASFKWSPVYGKMTWLNSKITPFDMYFSLGGGMTSTNQGTSEATLNLGTGQIFARSKGMAYRWDFSWNMFSAKSSVDPSGQAALYHNLLLTMGVSFFFPEATYR